jgi:hypothetical protein
MCIKAGLVIILIILLVVIAGCTPGNTPPVTTPEEEPFRPTQEDLDLQVEKMHTAFTEEEILELNEITLMAVNALQPYERSALIKLQEKFAAGGYAAMSDTEISMMRELNDKAFSLLPKEYQDRLHYLADKMERR